MALSEKTSLTIKINGDAKSALDAVNKVRGKVSDLGGVASSVGRGDIGGLTDALSGLIGGLGPAGMAAAGVTAGLAALGGIAATTIGTMFALAKQAAEYGSKIYDASVQTGLSTDAVEALNFIAEQSGTELGALTQAAFKFSVMVGKAAEGSENAVASLKKLGVAKEDLSNLDVAFGKAIKTLSGMEDAFQRNSAAAEAFGARNAKAVLGAIEQMNGDLPGTIDYLKKMGIAMGEEGVRNADKFDDSLALVNAQIQGISRNVGAQLLPAFSALFSQMSKWLAENQGLVDRLGQALVGMLAQFVGAGKAIAQGIMPWDPLFVAAMQIGAAEFIGSFAAELEAAKNVKPPPPPGTGGGKGDGGAKKKAEKDKARQERIKALELEIKEIEQEIREADRKLADELAKRPTSDPTIFREPTPGEVQASIENALDQLEEYYTQLAEARAKIAAEKLGKAESEAERANIRKEFQLEETDAEQKYQEKRLDILKTGTDRYNNLVKKGGERTLAEIKRSGREQLAFLEYLKDQKFFTEEEYLNARLAIQQQLLDAEIEILQEQLNASELEADERAQLLQKIKDLNAEKVTNEIETQQAIDNAKKKPEEQQTALDRLKQSWEDYFNSIKEGAGSVEGALGTLGQMGLDMLQNMEGALKSSIANWLLYGESVGKALKKALAAQLASMSAEALVWAIKATALGFYLLAIQDYAGAASAFKSAAIWGAVALVAGAAARGLAKGAFGEEAGRATKSSNTTERNVEGQGQAYSSQGNQTVNATMGGVSLAPTAEIVIRDASGMFSQLFEAEIKNNSRVRRLIIDTANS